MTDEQLLYACTGFCFLLILLSFRYSTRFAMINFIVLVLYSCRMYYGLFYQSQYGGGLVWWFYLLIMLLIQILILSIFLLYNAFKRKNKRRLN
jgi:uncharacterized membrane protein